MRKTLILALMCAASLAACNKDDGSVNVGPEPGAPPLLAGIDEGAKPGDPGYDPNVSTGNALPKAAGAAAGPAAPRVAAAAPDGSRPVRKAGLWQITRTSTGGPPPGAFGGGGGRPGGAPGGGGPGAGAPGGAAGAGRGPQGPQGPENLCVDAASEAIRGVFAAPRGQDCTPKLTKTAKGWSQSYTCSNPGRDGATMTTSSNETLTGDLNTRYTVSGTNKVSGGDLNFTRTTTVTGVYKGACPAGQKGGDMTDASGQTRNILQGGGGRRPGGGGGQ